MVGKAGTDMHPYTETTMTLSYTQVACSASCPRDLSYGRWQNALQDRIQDCISRLLGLVL